MNPNNTKKRVRITFVAVALAAATVLASACTVRADTWTQKADMPTPRWAHSVAVVNNKIYAIGGTATETAPLNGKALAAVEEYDPATDTWARKADMPADMIAAKIYGVAQPPVLDGKIYLFGGGLTGTARTDIYDPVADAWSRGADMPTPRNNPVTVIWNGKIYVFGGLRSFWPEQSLNSTEVYDPKTDTWSQAAPIPKGVWGHTAHVVDGKIHLIGGTSTRDAARFHQVYDPRTDTWTNSTPIPVAVRNAGGGMLRGRIYVVGGWFNSSGPIYSDTWVYDPLLDTWEASAPLPEGRIPSVAVVNGRIYAIGGSPTGHNIQATSTVYELTLDYDLTGDGIVDVQDISILVDHWHTDNARYDINGDGIVDVQDLILLSEHLFEDYRLVAHWMLDETEGMFAYDSAAENDGIASGNPVWQPDGGQVGGALAFDGIDDYISTDFVLDPSLGAFSVFVWIKGGAPGEVILSQQIGANWLMTDSSDGALRTELKQPATFGRNATLAGPPLISTTTVTDGDWHRIGFVRDSSSRILYIDGVEAARDTALTLESAYGGLYIGAGARLEASAFWSGLIDDVRIYNRAVSP